MSKRGRIHRLGLAFDLALFIIFGGSVIAVALVLSDFISLTEFFIILIIVIMTYGLAEPKIRKEPDAVRERLRRASFRSTLACIVGYLVVVAGQNPKGSPFSVPLTGIGFPFNLPLTIVGYLSILTSFGYFAALYTRVEYIGEKVTVQTFTKVAVPSVAQTSSSHRDKFQRAFEDVKHARSPETKNLTIAILRSTLSDLCLAPQWDSETRQGIIQFLDWVSAGEFNDNRYQDLYLDLLSLIVFRNDKETIEATESRFFKRIETMYYSSDFGSDSTVTRDRLVLPLLQRLRNRELVYMIELVNDALDKWDAEKFQKLLSIFELDQMDKDNGDYRKLRSYLLDRHNKAAEARDDPKMQRVVSLLKTMPLC